ncbi:hypothetical protein Acr_04g0001040 [Actinidia rufa]|uniref:Uncharacterized protein n=1 Tax=Actinidia rufa TaxID=165716 RepID=A0A7J0EGP8_9ERIC|nr:hypothetical protein Acr_04g0001040 [Actinidia rufa]
MFGGPWPPHPWDSHWCGELLESIRSLRLCRCVVGIDRRREVRFDRRRCDSRCSSAIQAIPDISGWGSSALFWVAVWAALVAVQFGLGGWDNAGTTYSVVWVLGSGFVMVAWALVGVIWAVVMAAWAAVVAMQIGFGCWDNAGGVVGIDHRQEVRFDWRRCNSRCSGAIQASPDLSLYVGGGSASAGDGGLGGGGGSAVWFGVWDNAGSGSGSGYMALVLLESIDVKRCNAILAVVVLFRRAQLCGCGVWVSACAWYGGWVVAFLLMRFGGGMDVWVLAVVLMSVLVGSGLGVGGCGLASGGGSAGLVWELG